MEIVIIVFMFLLGTIFGSFFNVVGYRLPKNISIIKPSSHCPKCKHKLTPLELIPIFSYIFLGGKCKMCKKKIPIFYPIFEVLTGIMFVLCYLVFGISPMLVLSLVFVSTVLIIMISDIKYMIIPDEVIIFSIISLFFIRLFLFDGTLVSIGLDMIIPFIGLLLLKLFGDLIFKKESMGGGDIKLMIVFGLAIGWELALVSVFLGAFLALPISVISLIRKKEHILPFGPYLSIAAVILMLSKIDISQIIDILIY